MEHPILDGLRLAIRTLAAAAFLGSLLVGRPMAGAILAALFLFGDSMVGAYVTLRGSGDVRPQ